MSNGIPTDERVSSSPALNGTGTAASVAEYDDDSSGPDEYGELLTAIGRTEAEDHRVSIHEAGHALCARLLGNPVGGMTVTPDPARGSDGMCWGIAHAAASTSGRGDASDVREALAAMMPTAGQDRGSVSDIFASSYSHVIELMAGRAAESMLLDSEPPPQADDYRQARELALLFCKTEEAVQTFIAHCEVAARDLLMPHGDVLMILSGVLRIKRELDGAEIDEIIYNWEAGKDLHREHRRRAQWCELEASAADFRAMCVPVRLGSVRS